MNKDMDLDEIINGNNSKSDTSKTEKENEYSMPSFSYIIFAGHGYGDEQKSN